MGNRKNRLVSVYVDQRIVDQMLATRARTGWALSEQVRLAVDAWLLSQETRPDVSEPRDERRRRRASPSAAAQSKKTRGRVR